MPSIIRPEQGVDDEAHHDHVGLQVLLALHDQVADALVGVDGLADHQRQPGDAEAEAQADEEGGQRARQDHLADHAPAADAAGARQLREARVDAADPLVEVQVDGEDHADHDEADLHALADAEPHDQQRHQAQERQGPEHLHRRVDELLADAREARDEAEDGADDDADGEPDRRAAATSGSRASSPTFTSSVNACQTSTGEASVPGSIQPTHEAICQSGEEQERGGGAAADAGGAVQPACAGAGRVGGGRRGSAGADRRLPRGGVGHHFTLPCIRLFVNRFGVERISLP